MKDARRRGGQRKEDQVREGKGNLSEIRPRGDPA
jgi:hypothetical protein